MEGCPLEGHSDVLPVWCVRVGENQRNGGVRAWEVDGGRGGGERDRFSNPVVRISTAINNVNINADFSLSFSQNQTKTIDMISIVKPTY